MDCFVFIIIALLAYLIALLYHRFVLKLNEEEMMGKLDFTRCKIFDLKGVDYVECPKCEREYKAKMKVEFKENVIKA